MSRIKLLSSLFLFLISFSVNAQLDDNFKLPETWEKDFVITLSYQNSMGGGKTEIMFTYDSCRYFSNPGRHMKTKSKFRKYRMKDTDRAMILKKLMEFKADQIKSEGSVHAVRDGWSQSICLNAYCIEGGTSAEMSEQDKNLFLDTYRYLEEFAAKKTR